MITRKKGFFSHQKPERDGAAGQLPRLDPRGQGGEQLRPEGLITAWASLLGPLGVLPRFGGCLECLSPGYKSPFPRRRGYRAVISVRLFLARLPLGGSLLPFLFFLFFSPYKMTFCKQKSEFFKNLKRSSSPPPGPSRRGCFDVYLIVGGLGAAEERRPQTVSPCLSTPSPSPLLPSRFPLSRLTHYGPVTPPGRR